MEIQNFIPFYPSIQNKDFYQQIYDKQEFKEDGKDGLLAQQQFIARFLSPMTLYNRVLLYHKMGTGKTCAAIAAVELLRKQLGRKIKCICISSKELANNFIQEIFKCTNIYDDSPKSKNYIKSQNYEFHTYYKALNGDSPRKIKQFVDSFVIVDEVQTIRNNMSSGEYMYLKKLIEESINCKFLLLSGTPMVDNWEEIIDVLNLILPEDLKKNSKLLKSSKLQKEFGEKIKGYVSFINSPAGINESQFMGNLTDVGKLNLTITSIQPRKLQYTGYAKAWNMDNKNKLLKIDKSNVKNLLWGKSLMLGGKNVVESSEKSGIYSNAIQASLFVWNSDKKLYNSNKKITRKKEWWEQNIREFSGIYSAIIDKIQQDETKKHFIFLKKVEGSGANLLYQILKKCGIKTKYIKTQKDTEEFNRSDRYKVAIGTAKISLGLTLRNIDFIHIAEPNWNFPLIEQAIARAIRHKSHDRKVRVEIFLYALIIKGHEESSINYIQYKTSSDKLYETQIITKILQENAIDCQKFKEHNKTTEKCTGITNPKHAPDYLTYNLYYTPFEKIRDEIIKFFTKIFICSIDEICKELSTYNKFEILDALSRINRENIVIYNQWGFKNYIRNCNNLYFLVIDKFNKGELLDVYYSKWVKNNPLPIPNNKLIDILFANQCKNIISIFNKDENTRDFFDELPIHIQEQILQQILLQKSQSKFDKWLLAKYKVWKKNGKKYIVYLQHLKNKKFPVKQYVKGKWIDSGEKIDGGEEIFTKIISKNDFVGVSKGVKGKNVVILDARKIKKKKENEGSKILRGIACTSIQRKNDQWKSLLSFLKIKDESTHKKICVKILTELERKKLIIDENQRKMLNLYMNQNELAFF